MLIWAILLRRRRVRRIPLRLAGGLESRAAKPESILKTSYIAAVLGACLAAAFAASAADPSPSGVTKDPAMADNPFARPSTLPFGMPPFEHIHDSDYLPAFNAG